MPIDRNSGIPPPGHSLNYTSLAGVITFREFGEYDVRAARRADPDLPGSVEGLPFSEQVNHAVRSVESLLHVRQVFYFYEQQQSVTRVVVRYG